MTTNEQPMTAIDQPTPIRHPSGVTAYIHRLGLAFPPGAVIALFLNDENLPLRHVQYDWNGLSPNGPSPRQVFHDALDADARFVILVQHHPTSRQVPLALQHSQIDHASRCALTGHLLGIHLLDYLVHTDTETVSLLLDHRHRITDRARHLARLQPPPDRLCLN